MDRMPAVPDLPASGGLSNAGPHDPEWRTTALDACLRLGGIIAAPEVRKWLPTGAPYRRAFKLHERFVF